jgi:hypothetical protein
MRTNAIRRIAATKRPIRDEVRCCNRQSATPSPGVA